MLVEIGMSHQIVVEYPKGTQLGCPLGVYWVYILCYTHCALFDHNIGMCVYRHIHNTKNTCVRTVNNGCETLLLKTSL